MAPPIDHPCLHLDVLRQSFSVKQYVSTDEILPDVLLKLSAPHTTTGIISITRTAEEISIVCEAEQDERDWKCIKIAGPVEFELTADVVFAFTTTLKDVEIPVFVISTWDTNYMLVPKERIMEAVLALYIDGWLFVEGSSVHPRDASRW